MEVPSNFKTLAAMTGGMTKSKMRRLKGRTWKFPLSFERQYTTSINRYFTKRWKEYASMAVQMMVPRTDAVEDLEPLPGQQGPALGAIVSIAENINQFNEKERNAFRKIVGGAALGDAFSGTEPWLKDALNRWANEQVTLITKATNDMRDAVARRIRDGVKKGMLQKDITKKILNDLPGMSFRRARIIARDQTSKLNAELTSRRMGDAGLETYVWSTSMDERVRGNPTGKYPYAVPSHWIMQGKICRWDDPTLWKNAQGEWEKRSADAPSLHPGQDIMCRCVALPNWDELEGVTALP